MNNDGYYCEDFFLYNYFYKYLEDLSFLYALYTGN